MHTIPLLGKETSHTMRPTSLLRTVALALPLLLGVALSTACAQDEGAAGIDVAAVLATATGVLSAEPYGYTCEAKENGGVAAVAENGPPLGVAANAEAALLVVTTQIPADGVDPAGLLQMANELNSKAGVTKFYVDTDGALMGEMGIALGGGFAAEEFAAFMKAFMDDVTPKAEG